MFSVSEIQESSDFRNISMFKAWWDILMDYLVAATALNVLLLLTRMVSVDTGGLICIDPLKNMSFGYVESRYINSRCCTESDAWIIIFHPYFVLLLWMCITACHLCWIKIPAINTKLEAFYAILYKIFTTQPKFYRSPYSLRMTQELSYNEANQKAIDVLLNKLLYLMTEKPFLRYSYMAKHLIIIIFCMISVTHAIFVVAFLVNYPSSFNCILKHTPPSARGYPFQNGTLIPIPCHLNIGPFIYVLIHVDFFIRIIMIGLCIKGLTWTWKGAHRSSSKKNKPDPPLSSTASLRAPAHGDTQSLATGSNQHKGEEDVFGEATEYLSGMPSYPDLLFCIELLRRNVHDGHLMYEAICTSIRNYVKKLRYVRGKYQRYGEASRNKAFKGNKIDENEQGLEKHPKTFHEYVVFVRWIAHELGLEEVPNMMDSSNLFACLQFIKDSLGVVDLSISQDIRTLIVNHLRSHPELYKTLIDEDPNFDDYETHCDLLSKPETYGSHYALLAASTLLNVKLIIIHCEPVRRLPEVYSPLTHGLLVTGNLRSCLTAETSKYNHVDLPTRFLTYVSPHFYHATVDMSVTPDWPHVVGRRMLYAVDRRFRWDLRQSAVRSIIVRNNPNLMYEDRN